MMPNEQKLTEGDFPESGSTVTDKDRTLILLKPERKRNIDQTISAPERYTSWYHYNTKHIDKYLQLCPHCKKPTFSAFDRAVVDSAVDYLNGKRMYMDYRKSRGHFLQSIIFMLAVSSVVYFIVSRL